MRLLLDTHLLLWLLVDPEKINDDVLKVFADRRHDLLFSAASIWEISIKAGLNRPDFRISPELILDEARSRGFLELPVTSAVAVNVATLPLHHRDPFDRLLVAQAMTEPAMLYTADAQLTAYSELVVHVA